MFFAILSDVIIRMIVMAYRAAILLLLFFSFPLLLFVGVLVFVTSGSPILFRQKRVGKNGTTFTLYKFRTMRVGAEKEQNRLLARNESKGPMFKIHDDPRFTRIGKFLSHTGLDELPQLWNVLRGEMALIGPRPLPVLETKKLLPRMRKRERVLPGIISPAVLTGSYHTDIAGWMRSDIAYARTKNVWGDFFLLLRFIPFGVKLLWRGLWYTGGV